MEAIYSHYPGLIVVAPATVEDVFNAQKRMIVREGTAQLSYLKNAREGTSLNKIYKSMDEDQFAPNTCKYKCIQAMLEVMQNENCSRLVEVED